MVKCESRKSINNIFSLSPPSLVSHAATQHAWDRPGHRGRPQADLGGGAWCSGFGGGGSVGRGAVYVVWCGTGHATTALTRGTGQLGVPFGDGAVLIA